ncbi:uncharacterized protein LOC119113226 [Pollicipes pollicipes]|uniref:uncharacterized protein LOC119113226 n=1 Tax=Pollicipes pollicipes TaxID=41117 RepID=UPI001884B200|nr:uncharacterized protein LOC119113226 [Pollicipes pollicipes]
MERSLVQPTTSRALFGYLLLFFLILALAGGVDRNDRSRDCALARVKPCVDRLLQLANDNVLVHATNETLLDDVCTMTRKAVECVTSYISNCFDKTDREVYLQTASSTKGIMNDICQPGEFRNRFLEHIPCLRLVTIDYNYCGYLYKKTVYHIERGDNAHATPETCCTYNKLNNCSRSMSRKLCDSEAAEFVDEFLERSGDVQLRGNCSAYQEDSGLCSGCGAAPGWPGWPALAAGVLLLFGRHLLGR